MMDFMRYSWEKINTQQAYDALLVQAQVKKQRLERRRRNLGEAIEVFRRRLDQHSQEWVQVQSALTAFTAAYEILPEGKDKATIKLKIKRLEVRLAVLERKAFTYNVGALLARQMKYNLLDNQMSVMEEYITSIKRRRAALSQIAIRPVQTVFLRPPVVRENSQPEVAKGVTTDKHNVVTKEVRVSQ